MNKNFITNNANQTQIIGVKLAKEILSRKNSPENRTRAMFLVLQGDLGAGKTTFLQGFSRGLGIKEKILSPTFILMRKFQIPNKKVLQNRRPSTLWYNYFYHIDCYRLENEADLGPLGFKEMAANPENIVAIEWPERIKKVLPKKVILIQFEHGAENHRTLTFKK